MSKNLRIVIWIIFRGNIKSERLSEIKPSLKEPSLLKKSGREIGEKIVSILKKNPEITNVEGILGARIPIVRFVHEESDLKCDLSFHNMMSVMNSKFLKMCQQADPRYVPDLFLRGHSITMWTRRGGLVVSRKSSGSCDKWLILHK